MVARLTLLWTLVLAAVLGVFGWRFWQGSRESLVGLHRTNLQHGADIVRIKLQSAFADLERDAAFLGGLPALAEFIATTDSPEHERWRAQLTDTFRALLAGKPTYFQVRLIGVADHGREIIRLDNDRGIITAVPADRLQEKGDRDYFRAALAPGAPPVLLSAIDLNQEFGRIEAPHRPTIRASARVAGPDGKPFGVVVINADVGPLLAEAQALPAAPARLVLAGDNGDYLIHPDAGARFGSDLGTGRSLTADRPDAASWADASWLGTWDGGDLAWTRRFPLDSSGARHLRGIVSIPAADWLRLLGDVRNRALAFTGAAALAGLVVIRLTARWLARRLEEVTSAMAGWEPGGATPGLTSGDDELGRLAAGLRSLTERVRADLGRIEAARREAEAATRLKDEFLAVMSHEIRTPMNAVTGLIRVLERSNPPPHQEPVLRSLRAAARHLMALLNDALDYTRLKADAIAFETAPFSLHDLLRDIAQMHRPAALQKGLRLELDLAPDLPDHVTGDAVRLTQVLTNLAGNAVKFTEHGHIAITARRGPPPLIVIAVRDTGRGLNPDDFSRLFQPFSRLGDGPAVDGAGLGLSIARSLVEKQGGTITAEGAPHAGACFTVSLPLPPAAAPAVSGSDDPAPTVPDLSGCRLLCVEDTASNREVLAALLAETRAVVDFAADAASALARLDGESWDLALLDLRLPDMDGVALARRFRDLAPDLPLFAVTAHAGMEIRAACRDAGFAEVILKPIDPATLFARLATHLAPSHRGKPDPSALRERLGLPPDRFTALLATIADEWLRAADELDAVLAADDKDALAAIRHRLHSSLHDLGLHAWRDALDAIMSGGSPTGAAAGLTDALRRHAAHLRTAAAAHFPGAA